MIDLPAAHARWYRLRRHGLQTPFADPLTAAGKLAGVQAQILPAAGIALWNRSPDFRAADLRRLLFKERRLVKLWGQRGTLHLYATDDWPLLHGAHADRPSYVERWVLAQGHDPAGYEQLIAQVAEALAARGSLGRSDLRALRATGLALSDGDLSGWGGIFSVLVRRGLACHGPAADGEARIVDRRHWVPELDWNPPAAAIADLTLTRRYLHAYGPASIQDLAYWRGRTIAEARTWLAALADELVEVAIDGAPQYLLRSDYDDLACEPPPRDRWPVRLLGRFDSLLLGHKDKSWLIDPEHYARVWRPAGHIEATLLVHGRIAGTWRYDWRGANLLLTVRPFRRPPAYVQRAVGKIAPQLAAHFGTALADLQWEETA
ncbi:MAG: winged helix DNA-binding domain-containing protein [Oscillochloris sp.]|nr:winged helix DNA-binding domain-containing protein [Oscillochloris sp.]